MVLYTAPFDVPVMGRKSFPRQLDEPKQLSVGPREDEIISGVLERVACVLWYNTPERERFARSCKLMSYHYKMSQWEAMVELYTRTFGATSEGMEFGHGTMH